MTSIKRAVEGKRRRLVPVARNSAVAAAVGVFLAFAGPFGTFSAPLWMRLAFWVSLLLAGAACASALHGAMSARPTVGTHPWLRWTFFTACITAPMWILSWSLSGLLFGSAGPSGLWSFLWPTALISGAMTALMMGVNSPGSQTSGDAAGGSNVLLRQRLPVGLRTAEIFAVSAEDHYLRVHTSAGSTLILMRLSDAIKELQGIEGAHVHRSWWVSRGAILGSQRSGRNVSLTVKGDLSVPVSRPNVRALQDSGWI